MNEILVLAYEALKQDNLAKVRRLLELAEIKHWKILSLDTNKILPFNLEQPYISIGKKADRQAIEAGMKTRIHSTESFSNLSEVQLASEARQIKKAISTETVSQAKEETQLIELRCMAAGDKEVSISLDNEVHNKADINLTIDEVKLIREVMQLFKIDEVKTILRRR
jgi:hypothetical protein